jgi:3'-phosphoadenosine 5'-phosphosulfate (PAPS) 3'-phosphatase
MQRQCSLQRQSRAVEAQDRARQRAQTWPQCRTLTTDDRQVHCKDYSHDAEGLNIVGSASHMNDITKQFMDMHKNPSLVQVGSSLKFLLVRGSRNLLFISRELQQSKSS